MRFVSFSFLFLTSCIANNGLGSSAMSETNVNNLARISTGMSTEEVLQVMHKPYNQEQFLLGDDLFDVWFYVTRPTGLGQSRMVPQNLTPLTFKNGILIGWGYDYYYYLVQQVTIQAKLQAPPPAQKSPEEDMEMEKALKPQPTSQNDEAQENEPESSPKDENEKLLDEEGNEMQEEESEQNFNFW